MHLPAAALLLSLGLAAPPAASSAALPPPLAPEESDVAVLPPPTAHRVWVADIYGGSARIVDGDTGAFLGTIDGASLSEFAAGPRQSTVYVAESIWTKGVRGDRQDMVTVYDGASLKLAAEIKLPGRIFMAPRPALFELNAARDTAFMYNLEPASSVVVIDLKGRAVVRAVDTPGCGLVFPWGAAAGDRGFSTLCANGALATVTWSAAGAGAQPSLARGKPFFDAEHDPVFQESPSDPASGRALFVTYSGRVHAARLGPAPVLEAPWSLQAAAGLPAGEMKDGSAGWYPGGRLPLAMHAASGRLYVLMHLGEAWSHKRAGTELWMVDAASRRVLRRVELDTPGTAIAVSQDAHPLLFAMDEKNVLTVRDALTLAKLRTVDGMGNSTLVVPGL